MSKVGSLVFIVELLGLRIRTTSGMRIELSILKARARVPLGTLKVR